MDKVLSIIEVAFLPFSPTSSLVLADETQVIHVFCGGPSSEGLYNTTVIFKHAYPYFHN